MNKNFIHYRIIDDGYNNFIISHNRETIVYSEYRSSFFKGKRISVFDGNNQLIYKVKSNGLILYKYRLLFSKNNLFDDFVINDFFFSNKIYLITTSGIKVSIIRKTNILSKGNRNIKFKGNIIGEIQNDFHFLSDKRNFNLVIKTDYHFLEIYILILTLIEITTDDFDY